jgi:hypothetical protein
MPSTENQVIALLPTVGNLMFSVFNGRVGSGECWVSVYCGRKVYWHLQSSKLPLSRAAGVPTLRQEGLYSPADRHSGNCWIFVHLLEAGIQVPSTEYQVIPFLPSVRNLVISLFIGTAGALLWSVMVWSTGSFQAVEKQVSWHPHSGGLPLSGGAVTALLQEGMVGALGLHTLWLQKNSKAWSLGLTCMCGDRLLAQCRNFRVPRGSKATGLESSCACKASEALWSTCARCGLPVATAAAVGTGDKACSRWEFLGLLTGHKLPGASRGTLQAWENKAFCYP